MHQHFQTSFSYSSYVQKFTTSILFLNVQTNVLIHLYINEYVRKQLKVFTFETLPNKYPTRYTTFSIRSHRSITSLPQNLGQGHKVQSVNVLVLFDNKYLPYDLKAI